MLEDMSLFLPKFQPNIDSGVKPKKKIRTLRSYYKHYERNMGVMQVESWSMKNIRVYLHFKSLSL